MTAEKQFSASKWLVFFLSAIGIFMSTLDSSIVNLALPTLMADLGVNMASVEWVVVIYLLTVSCFLLVFGRLSDILGRRWVYCRGLIVFAAGSLLCATAEDIRWLVASRGFQGLGAAMIMSCTPALVADVFPVAQRGKALGMVGAVVASGLSAGPALGGWILQAFSWRVIFYINVPVGVLAAAFTWRVLQGEKPASPGDPFDWPGGLFLCLTFAAFIILVSQGPQWGWVDHRVWALAAVLALCLPAFVFRELKAPSPLIELSLWKIPLFSASIVAAIAMFASLFFVVFLMPFFLMGPAEMNPGEAGAMMVAPFFFLFVGAPFSGAASDRLGSRILTFLGMSVLCMALWSFTFLTTDSSRWDIFWRLAVTGTGVAIFSSPNSAAALSAVPGFHRGVAAATTATGRNLGMVLGVALAAMVFSTRFAQLTGGQTYGSYTPQVERAFLAAFSRACAAGALIAATGAMVSLFRGPENRME